MIAKRFTDLAIAVVAGPTTGGVILAFEVARQMGIRAAFAEKEGDNRIIKRGHSISHGDNVLIVDDIFTTGKSVREVIKAVEERGGEIVAIAVLVDRSVEKHDFGVPFYSCLRTEPPLYTPAKCPQCVAGIPLARHGKKLD